MTQLTLSMLLRAEGAPAAKAAIQDVATSTDRLGTSTTRGAAADRAAATAKQANAQAARQLASANSAAAGATGNLFAQLQDVGMMLAAGQNPLQLAVQQGGQITQAFGQAGATGALNLLKGAFLQLLNPISLVTFGVIAASGYMLQWLTSAEDEAADVTSELEKQKAAIQGIIEETERLRLARGMMLSGAETANEQQLLEENNRLLAEREAIDARLANQSLFVGNARAAALQAELEARRAAINVQIGSNNELLVGIQREREKNAETAKAVDLAGQVRAATQGIASALQAVNGSRLQAAFASAFPAANQLLGMAQSIIATIGAASAQASAMQSAETAGLAAQYAQYGAGRTIGERLARESGSLYGGRRVIPAPVVAGGGGGGGGGGAARDEANALQELIASLEGEIEALRVQDPIQQELLKHREALAGATEAEKAKVEELIAVREREAAALEGAKARREFFEDLGNNALEALIVKGESFNDVLKNIGQSLIQAGIQAALFGSGPFGSLFGGKSVLSMIFPALGGKAEGGIITGPGTGTSDSILTRLSNGEFVVNAKATSRNRHLLEAINAGSLPGYAAGGMVGGDTGRMIRRGAGGGPSTLIVDVRGAQGNIEIKEMVRRGVQIGLQLYDREALPRSVKRVSADQKRVN